MNKNTDKLILSILLVTATLLSLGAEYYGVAMGLTGILLVVWWVKD